MTLAVMCLACAAVLPMPVRAASRDVEDIAAFRLTDVSGHIKVGYIYDDQERGSTSLETNFETRANWEQELFIDTNSFIYHPGFLNIELGGGPLLLQQQFDSTLGSNSNSETLFNYRARFNFLELKTYPFSFFAQRSHPAVYTSLAGRFLTRNNEYGFEGHVFDLFDSTTLWLDVRHWDTRGSGFESIVDEDVDKATISVRTNYRDSDHIEAKYIRTDRASGSGSLGLPIQQTQTLTETAELRATNRFGARKQLEIIQILRGLQQDIESATPSVLDDRQYQADARWKHSDRTRSYLRLRSYETDRLDTNSVSRNAQLGMARSAVNGLGYDVSTEYADVEQQGFTRDRVGARGSVMYTRETGFGSFGLSGSLGAARSDQVSASDSIQVFDEAVVLEGTTPVDLANEFVIAGSVVVSNATRTQVYVEGLDYRLVEIGSVTQIQRLVGGAITDGETVLVDYRYRTSGTAEFDTLDAGLSASIRFFDNLDAYVRYGTRETDVVSGQLTNPTNDRDTFEVGLGIRNRFLDGWGISGQLRHLDQDEEISPFVRDSVDVSLNGAFFNRVKVTVSAGLADVDRRNSPEDVRQTTYRVVLSGRLGRSILSYQGSWLEDTGGTLPRDQLLHRLNLQWAYRQVRFLLRAQHTRDTLGLTERSFTNVSAQVTRAF